MSGKYINQDAALQAMWNALYALEDRQEAESGLDIMRRADVQAGFEAGQQVIAEFPAADVVEVRHGQWYLDNGCAYCSECKNSFAPGIRSQALFCPRCGAKMDGGQKDD